ncbi:hypothetical protein GW17_00027891, partial [Ensete ventricosum]
VSGLILILGKPRAHFSLFEYPFMNYINQNRGKRARSLVFSIAEEAEKWKSRGGAPLRFFFFSPSCTLSYCKDPFLLSGRHRLSPTRSSKDRIFLVLCLLPSEGESLTQAYVVYLGEHSHGSGSASPWEASKRATDAHYELLGSVLAE